MALKRSTESTSSHSAANKKVRFSEDTMKVSSCNPDSLPENMFHLGAGNYVVVTDFADVIRVHIRFYKPDLSGSLKPTKRGVSLTTSHWQALSASMDIISLSESKDVNIIENSLLLATELINDVKHITIQRFFQKKDLSHKFVPDICLMSEAEWEELKKLREKITSLAIITKFGRVFHGMLLCEVRRRIPSVSVPEDNIDAEMILTTSMSELLMDYLSSNIRDIFLCNGCDMGLANQLGHECVTLNLEMRAEIYSNRALLKIELNAFVSDYVERNIHMCNYIHERFLKSLNMSNIVKTAIDLYIASDPDPLRIF